MDVCPVGAITTKEYRFKSRPWDNPGVVDTTHALLKGATLAPGRKQSPRGAKGSRLIRMTPRLNPEINGTDVRHRPVQLSLGEGDKRLRRPMVRSGADWSHSPGKTSAISREAVQSAGWADPSSVRFLVSAHASTEELFVLRDVVTGLLGDDGPAAVTVSWKTSQKASCRNKVRRTSTDAPNVNGARDVGFAVGQGNGRRHIGTANRDHVGRVKALYVVDPGPDGSPAISQG